jgi:organic hydroperoxide reductase OsmC/OhrA
MSCQVGAITPRTMSETSAVSAARRFQDFFAGEVSLGSGAFRGPYSYMSRFEEDVSTNPEELRGAAHAGCFTMALSAALARAGHVRSMPGSPDRRA